MRFDLLLDSQVFNYPHHISRPRQDLILLRPSHRIRNIIYDFTRELDLELLLYTIQIENAGYSGTIPYNYLKTEVANLINLAKICRYIEREAIEHFFQVTQLYIRHEPYAEFWPPEGPPFTDYERIIILVQNEPVLRQARHVRWTVYLETDEGVFKPSICLLFLLTSDTTTRDIITSCSEKQVTMFVEVLLLVPIEKTRTYRRCAMEGQKLSESYDRLETCELCVP